VVGYTPKSICEKLARPVTTYMQSYTYNADLVLPRICDQCHTTRYNMALCSRIFDFDPQIPAQNSARGFRRDSYGLEWILIFFTRFHDKNVHVTEKPSSTRETIIVRWTRIFTTDRRGRDSSFFFRKSQTKLKLPRKPRKSRRTDRNRCTYIS